jgi:hypothetical protein
VIANKRLMVKGRQSSVSGCQPRGKRNNWRGGKDAPDGPLGVASLGLQAKEIEHFDQYETWDEPG